MIWIENEKIWALRLHTELSLLRFAICHVLCLDRGSVVSSQRNAQMTKSPPRLEDSSEGSCSWVTAQESSVLFPPHSETPVQSVLLKIATSACRAVMARGERENWSGKVLLDDGYQLGEAQSLKLSKARLGIWARWFSRSCPCPWQRGWKLMILNRWSWRSFPTQTNLWFYDPLLFEPGMVPDADPHRNSHENITLFWKDGFPSSPQVIPVRRNITD